LDNDFSRLFAGEALLRVGTLNIDAASFAQIEEQALHEESLVATRAPDSLGSSASFASLGSLDAAIAHIVLRTVTDRGKQHNPVTGSGGMLVGRVLQLAPGRGAEALQVGDRVATLASLTLTPLRVDRVLAVRRATGQLDIEGEAVIFGSAPYAKLPEDIAERLALAVLDVAGAAPQVARLVHPGQVVLVLGAGGKSGMLSAAQARRSGGESVHVVGIESRSQAAEELASLGICNDVVVTDARDPLAVREALLRSSGGREADVTFSCVNVKDAELAAVLATRERGIVYFFAMSTSFTQAALGAEGVGKDVDLFIGNGYAVGHADHTLALLRELPALGALFAARYG
jgi:L-erythro-3,5-diaminohexanoate dehydrogenase